MPEPTTDLSLLTAGEQLLRQRRSIRKYTAEPVAPELVERLLQAGMAAPSASNKRPWEFVVIDDPELLKSLQQRLILGRYSPPLVIIVCGNMSRTYPQPARDFWMQDCSAAAQNIMIAATAMALGSVWIGIHPVGLLARAVAKLLQLPKDVLPLGAIYVGHAAEAKEPRTQYDPARVHHNRF